MGFIPTIIEEAFEKRHEHISEEAIACTFAVLNELNLGRCRVCEKKDGQWVVNTWIKKAILLHFQTQPSQVFHDGLQYYYDKIPLKFSEYRKPEDWKALGARVVPQATVRTGAFIGKKVVLMPSYVNIGAYVGEGSMIDTWATVGSCAQIGKRVHLSGGAGIGGVLEPLQAQPTIIEDDCFIGARSEIVEGVIVEQGAVIAMGVFIGQSTKIYDRTNGQIYQGRVPAHAVVVPGSLPASDGSHALACAVIVKYADPETRAKLSLNELLRD